MTNKDTPAFPCAESENYYRDVGMTLRQYAAIKLRVPDSGDDWLDEMIRKSIRNDFAAKAMQALVANSVGYSDWTSIPEDSYSMADDMMKAREE